MGSFGRPWAFERAAAGPSDTAAVRWQRRDERDCARSISRSVKTRRADIIWTAVDFDAQTRRHKDAKAGWVAVLPAAGWQTHDGAHRATREKPGSGQERGLQANALRKFGGARRKASSERRKKIARGVSHRGCVGIKKPRRGDDASAWASKQLAKTGEDEPGSTERLEMLADLEKFVVAAFGLDCEPDRNVDVDFVGFEQAAFDGVAFVSN